MSDDQTRPTEPDAPVPADHPAYAAPVAQRPRFADQVLGMRAVVAVALACLVIGGLSGWILGHAAGSDRDGFGRGPAFMQRGGFPDGGQVPNGQPPNGQPPGTNGTP